MRFLRPIKGCTRRDRLYDEDIRKQLKIFNIQVRTVESKEKWVARENGIPDGTRCLWNFGNTNMLCNEVQEGLGNIDDVDIFL